jgi:Exo-beta-D-glucosaminidase Ig-fold domain
MNNTNHVVPMVKLKVVGDRTGERILPVIFSDNYVTLMPGEKRSIRMDLEEADTRGEKPEVLVEGYHVE